MALIKLIRCNSEEVAQIALSKFFRLLLYTKISQIVKICCCNEVVNFIFFLNYHYLQLVYVDTSLDFLTSSDSSTLDERYTTSSSTTAVGAAIASADSDYRRRPSSSLATDDEVNPIVTR